MNKKDLINFLEDTLPEGSLFTSIEVGVTSPNKESFMKLQDDLKHGLPALVGPFVNSSYEVRFEQMNVTFMARV